MTSKGAGVRGSAACKKKDGTLSISKDKRSVVWVPSKSSEVVTIAIADIASEFIIRIVDLALTLYRFSANA